MASERRTEIWILVLGAVLTLAGVVLFAAAAGTTTIAGSSEKARALLATRPLPAVVTVTARPDDAGGERAGLPALVRQWVRGYGRGAEEPFPIPGNAADEVRAADGLDARVLVRWLDPLTADTSLRGPRFGASPDGLVFVPDGPRAGWLWANHERLAAGEGNRLPRIGVGPSGQPLTLALWMKTVFRIHDDPTNDAWSREEVDEFLFWQKSQVGGSRLHVVEGDEGEGWRLDRGATNLRFDATSRTRFALTGARPSASGEDDLGGPIEPVAGRGVIPGTLANGAAALTPWGTILSLEGPSSDAYGRLEACWPASGDGPRFDGEGLGFRPGGGLRPPFATDRASRLGGVSDDYPWQRRHRDLYGWAVEIDPARDEGVAYGQEGDGHGHRKVGAMGRGEWEGAAFWRGPDGRPAEGAPVVVYLARSGPGGALWKFVSRGVWRAGMDEAAKRALLDEGTLYVAEVEDLDNRTGLHHAAPDLPLDELRRPTQADPLQGRWIEMSLGSADVAPNAAALGRPDETVGAALRDESWGGLAGFEDENILRACPATACLKIGVREWNHPRGVAFAPTAGRLYVALAGYEGSPRLLADGRLAGEGVHVPERGDREGALWAVEETDGDRPWASRSFRVHEVWRGWGPEGLEGEPSAGADPRVVLDPRFAATHPCRLVVDAEGGLWFTTDGAWARTDGHSSDALYYLDQGAKSPTRGLAFRVAAVPADAAPGAPCFTPDERTLFLGVKHPGERVPSAWPSR